ncbi:MAG TPA: hypothetical protein VIH46_11230 [Candidatus Acidoferrales bacterium]
MKFQAQIFLVLSRRSGCGDLGWRCWDHGRNDAPEGKNTEKLLTAWIAAIGRETQQALHRCQRALLHPFPGNVLEIEIPATRAVHKAGEADGDRPGIKSQLAGLASPGSQAGKGGEKVGYATAV